MPRGAEERCGNAHPLRLDSVDMDSRLRALCELSVPEAREYGGRHEYDGLVQDLSPAGVRRDLALVGGDADTTPYPDHHDEVQTSAHEDYARVVYGELELHRRNPLYHLGNLDLACYDREYALALERAAAKQRHLAAWPDAVDAAVWSLDSVSAIVATSLLPATHGLADGITAEDKSLWTRRCSDAPAKLGASTLQRLLSTSKAMPINLGELIQLADSERDRLKAMLAEGCQQLAPGVPTQEVLRRCVSDHPSATTVVAEAHTLSDHHTRGHSRALQSLAGAATRGKSGAATPPQ